MSSARHSGAPYRCRVPVRLADRQISVVIPSHNRAGLVDVAIASILRSPLIASPEQIVVVDDDSQDHTKEVARQRGVTYIRVAYHNISRSRNAGFALAQTPYVAFLDDDDAWLPGNMEAQLAALEDHPGAAFAYGIARCATEDLQPLPWTFPSPPLASGIAPEHLHRGYPNLGVVLFRREAVARAGGFDPRIIYYQDADLMIRLAARHEIVGTEFVGMLYRVRTPSRTRNNYHWANRGVRNWWPKRVGVGWKSAATLMFKLRRMLYHFFCEDAGACASMGNRRDALVCLSRAFRVSPAHALRHSLYMASILWACFRGRQPRSMSGIGSSYTSRL
jgi:glycosyltransferase involved in cell wall biosynthesis